MRVALLSFLLAGAAAADVGDPQTRTDHPYYPGELSCSTFERLFATQAELYQNITGAKPKSDEEKALASWCWRNLHYWHGEEGTEDLWAGEDTKAARKVSEVGGSLRDVQSLAGHASISITQRYVDEDPQAQRKLVDRL